MAFKEFCEFLLRRTGPYQARSHGSEYAEIRQHGIQNTVPISRLITVAKEGVPDVDITTDSRTRADTNYAKEVLTLKAKEVSTLEAKEMSALEEKDSYSVGKIVGRQIGTTRT